MHKILTICCVILALAACNRAPQQTQTPKEQLLERLAAASADKHILYGHQDDLAYGHAWLVTDVENDPLERSDVRAVSGHYPAIVGFDLGGIEMGDRANLDSVPFTLIRKAALTHIDRGGVVTFSWHLRNPLTGGDAWDFSSREVVASVLDGGSCHEEFMVWMERLGDFLESLGEVPAIFRPWHENIGTWFWWGGEVCTAEEFKALWELTWKYLVEERGLANLVWCYSPNGPISAEDYMSRYPGDEYVDILGTDIYEYPAGAPLPEAAERYRGQVSGMMATLAPLAEAHGKLFCLSETGFEGIPDPVWWTEALYPAIEGTGVCYVLTWRNAHDKPGHFYGPWEGFENAGDFAAFADKEDIELL